MIIFFSEGRLGNQLFQYAFLKTIQKKDEKLIVFGFDDLLKVFDVLDNTLINIPRKKYITHVYYKVLRPFLYKTSELKILSYLQIKYEYLGNYRRETTEFIKNRGFLDRLLLVKTGYFQSEKFFNYRIINNIKIKKFWEQKALKFLKEMKILDKYKVFVHIRRGDYKNFYVFGKSSILPLSYFHERIEWFLKNRENVHFIFLSDEPDGIEKEFFYLKNKVVSYNTYEIDFAIMSFCEGAILSPSSFGWWGSYLMKKRDVVFAPKYWLGWASKIEYQKGAVASYMKEVVIKE